MNDFVYETDVHSLIRINSNEDIINKRNEIINYVWSGNNFPLSKLPQDMNQKITDLRYQDLENLQHIDKINYEMEFGINSISYIFSQKMVTTKL